MRLTLTTITTGFLIAMPANAPAPQQIPADTTQAPQRSGGDCLPEYRRAMTTLGAVVASLDAAERSHDELAILATLANARRVRAEVKSRLARCPGVRLRQDQ